MNTHDPSQWMERDERKNTNVDDCRFLWQKPDGTEYRWDAVPWNSPEYKAHDEAGRDTYATVLCGDKIVYREHKSYCHIDDAWRILATGRPAKWKTAEMLVTLRQALRERYAQCMALDIPRDGIGLAALRKFLTIARHYDAIHHGSNTF